MAISHMLESKSFRVWLAATLLVVAASSGEAVCAQDKQNAPEAEIGTYVVCVGDHLEISVWRHPELSKRAVVDRDGNINLPSINAVKVSGLSVTDLAGLLVRRFKSTIPKPHVTIAVSRTSCLPKPPVPKVTLISKPLVQ